VSRMPRANISISHAPFPIAGTTRKQGVSAQDFTVGSRTINAIDQDPLHVTRCTLFVISRMEVNKKTANPETYSQEFTFFHMAVLRPPTAVVFRITCPRQTQLVYELLHDGNKPLRASFYNKTSLTRCSSDNTLSDWVTVHKVTVGIPNLREYSLLPCLVPTQGVSHTLPPLRGC